MLLPSLVALALLNVPATMDPPRARFDSVVPRLPDGYGPGRVSIRVHTTAIPEAASIGLVGELFARTGLAITETQGVRIEVVVPDDVRFDAIEARIVDGLVLEPEKRSFIGRVGSAFLSLLRILLVGKLVDAADELALPGVAWATALGMSNPGDELVKLSTSDRLLVERESENFSDHGQFSVCRTMLALSPWSELVEVQLRGRDRTTGEEVAFLIPRLPLRSSESPGPEAEESSQWAIATAAGAVR